VVDAAKCVSEELEDHFVAWQDDPFHLLYSKRELLEYQCQKDDLVLRPARCPTNWKAQSIEDLTAPPHNFPEVFFAVPIDALPTLDV
nr:hypothetical protein [Tanacetum cinerariifolium]